MAVGFLLTLTVPFAAVTVTGKLLAVVVPWVWLMAGAELDELPQPATTAAMAAAARVAAAGRRLAAWRRARWLVRTRWFNSSSGCLGQSASVATPWRDRNEPPFLRGQVVDAGQASGLVLRRRLVDRRDARHHRCGTAPDSHRLRWAQRHPGAGPGQTRYYCPALLRCQERRLPAGGVPGTAGRGDSLLQRSVESGLSCHRR